MDIASEALTKNQAGNVNNEIQQLQHAKKYLHSAQIVGKSMHQNRVLYASRTGLQFRGLKRVVTYSVNRTQSVDPDLAFSLVKIQIQALPPTLKLNFTFLFPSFKMISFLSSNIKNT